jgi:tetratricopeptide (TPR) repeat protein
MRYVIISLSIFFIITGSTMVIDHYYRIAQEEKAKEDIDKAKIDAMEALYREQDYERAASLFQKVLKNDPFNYEVTFYLAVTLDRLGRTDEAYPLWERILRMAEIYQDKSKADMARNRIKKKP